jgi:hypothetical protein
MSNIKAKKRHSVIQQNRKRRTKLRALKTKHENASGSEKAQIKEKIKRVAPHLNVDEWLSLKS